MSTIKKKELGIGAFLLATFIAVMIGIFLPLFDGENALNYLDNLYNSISKGSAYYIPKVERRAEEHGSDVVTLNLKMTDPRTAQAAEQLFSKTGATTAVEDNNLMVNGDLETIFKACLEDAESAYHNRSDDLMVRYGMEARPTLHTWWQASVPWKRTSTGRSSSLRPSSLTPCRRRPSSARTITTGSRPRRSRTGGARCFSHSSSTFSIPFGTDTESCTSSRVSVSSSQRTEGCGRDRMGSVREKQRVCDQRADRGGCGDGYFSAPGG